MLKAEALAEQGDALANLSCSVAYQGFAGGGHEQQERKANFFLRRAAELGHPGAQHYLAQHLLWGLNGVERNEREYEIWISRAIEQGDETALIEHIENRRKLKREIEPSLMTKLEVLATRSERAGELLRKINRAAPN